MPRLAVLTGMPFAVLTVTLALPALVVPAARHVARPERRQAFSDPRKLRPEHLVLGDLALDDDRAVLRLALPAENGAGHAPCIPGRHAPARGLPPRPANGPPACTTLHSASLLSGPTCRPAPNAALGPVRAP